MNYQVGRLGLVNGDSLSGALARLTTSSNVGAYGLTQGTLTASGSYALNYASVNLTVSQRSITVTADAKSRAYGDKNPALTYQVAARAWSTAIRLSGALATSAPQPQQCRGDYRFPQGTLAASGNYALNDTSAGLTVGQRAITVTADAKSRAYGDANPMLTFRSAVGPGQRRQLSGDWQLRRRLEQCRHGWNWAKATPTAPRSPHRLKSIPVLILLFGERAIMRMAEMRRAVPMVMPNWY